MEDKIPVKILEVGEGEIVVVVGIGGHATRLREGHMIRGSPHVEYIVAPRSERLRPAEPPTFRLEGQHWRVVFEGVTCLLDDSVGLSHLARLLGSPGKEIRCDTLLALHAGETQPPAAGAADLASDARALREIRARLSELAEEVAAAEGAGDGEQALLLREERAQLEAHLRGVTRMGGRPRRVNDDLERARQAVSAAIRRTLKVLRDGHPGLWRHLYRHLRVGTMCEYRPDPMVTWITT
jgi:hypothetical protein